jgi:c-di-GMP-binding flagellar brake protein YcgR
MPEADIVIDKRVHPRVSLKMHVKYLVLNNKKEYTTILDRQKEERISHSVDVSLGGMYLVADHTLPVGSNLRMNIYLPDHSHTIGAYAEVVWSNATGGGLQFEAIKDEDVERLRECLLSTPLGKREQALRPSLSKRLP